MLQEITQEVTGITKPSLKGSNWCFTINNPTDEDLVVLNQLKQEENLQYITWQLEKEKTLHIQGYLELKKCVTFGTIKKYLPRAHIEKRKGTQQQAIDYCKKLESRVSKGETFGEPKKQGRRNDLLHIKKLLDEGKGMEYISDNHFGNFVRYNRGFEKYLMYKKIERKQPEVIIFIGPPGSCKTYLAKKISKGLYYTKGKGPWFDGYDGEKTIIFEEFTGDIEMETMNIICDTSVAYLPIKGTFAICKADTIIITSNQLVCKWWPGKDIRSFASRITYYVSGPWDNRESTRKAIELEECTF